jgi:HEAT repeat protein
MTFGQTARFGLVGLLLAAGTAFVAVQSVGKSTDSKDRRAAVSDTSGSAERVEAAFAAARSGDFGPSSELASLGEAAAPLLAPYVTDGDEEIRRQAVALLAAINGKGAVAPLAKALADGSQDIRQRASAALYEHYDPRDLGKRADLGEALRSSIRQGNDSGGAILLLGYFSGPKSKETLRDLRDRHGGGRTEVFSWSPVVPISLAADVALSRLGDEAARRALTSRIEAGELEDLQFLLYTLRDIDSPPVIHALMDATLDDMREVPGEVPSGAEPQIRLQDLAVTQLVKRFGLRMPFDVSGDRRYSDDEIAAVREAVDKRVPM